MAFSPVLEAVLPFGDMFPMFTNTEHAVASGLSCKSGPGSKSVPCVIYIRWVSKFYVGVDESELHMFNIHSEAVLFVRFELRLQCIRMLQKNSRSLYQSKQQYNDKVWIQHPPFTVINHVHGNTQVNALVATSQSDVSSEEISFSTTTSVSAQLGNNHSLRQPHNKYGWCSPSDLLSIKDPLRWNGCCRSKAHLASVMLAETDTVWTCTWDLLTLEASYSLALKPQQTSLCVTCRRTCMSCNSKIHW